MLLLFFAALAAPEPDPCAQAPSRPCLLDSIRASPWMASKPPKRLTVTIRGLVAAVEGDEEAAKALNDVPDQLFGDRDFARHDLVGVYARFGRVAWAEPHLTKLPRHSALHWQGKLALQEQADPAKVPELVAQVPADLRFRGQVVAQAIGILLRADRIEPALALARELPKPGEGNAPPMVKSYDRQQGVLTVALWSMKQGEVARARALRAELSDPAPLDAVLRWEKADSAALEAALAEVPAEGWDRDQRLQTLGNELLTARRFELLPKVLERFEVQKYSDPRRKLVTAHLLLLARHDDWGTVRKVWDAYEPTLRTEAVYPLMILALEGEPTKERVELAREALPQAASFSLGYQKELAQALLARALGT